MVFLYEKYTLPIYGLLLCTEYVHSKDKILHAARRETPVRAVPLPQW